MAWSEVTSREREVREVRCCLMLGMWSMLVASAWYARCCRPCSFDRAAERAGRWLVLMPGAAILRLLMWGFLLTAAMQAHSVLAAAALASSDRWWKR